MTEFFSETPATTDQCKDHLASKPVYSDDYSDTFIKQCDSWRGPPLALDCLLSDSESSQNCSPLSLTLTSKLAYTKLSPRKAASSNQLAFVHDSESTSPRRNVSSHCHSEVTTNRPDINEAESLNRTRSTSSSWLDDLLGKLKAPSLQTSDRRVVTCPPSKSLPLLRSKPPKWKPVFDDEIYERPLCFSRSFDNCRSDLQSRDLLPSSLPDEKRKSSKANIYFIPADACVEEQPRMVRLINQLSKKEESVSQLSLSEVDQKPWRGSQRFRGKPLWERRGSSFIPSSINVSKESIESFSCT